VSEDNIEFDVNIDTVELGVTITVNDGDQPISDLLTNGTFTGADIRVYNGITRLQMATDVDENGRFKVIRPRGEIELFLYLYKDSSYEIYPLQQTPDSRKYDLQGNAELTFDLPLTNFTIIVQKNGEALPDSINPSYTRGNVFFKSRESNNWQLEVRYDLGKTGDVYDFFSMKTGEYSVNFSVGYGLPFSFMQWVYLGCLEVNP